MVRLTSLCRLRSSLMLQLRKIHLFFSNVLHVQFNKKILRFYDNYVYLNLQELFHSTRNIIWLASAEIAVSFITANARI